MDPFEGRLQFLDLLKRLQASQTSQVKTAQFALRHQDLDEDLFSCVLEELSVTSFNARVNILYFLETLCDVSQRSGNTSYIAMVSRDLSQIIDFVAPQNGQGQANVAQVRHFLRKMLEKQFLSPEEHERFDGTLMARDTQLSTQPTQLIPKEDILRRFEEDRERHKKLRETVWVIPSTPIDAEFNQAWEETSDLCDDDYDAIREDLNLYTSSLIRA